MKESSARKTLGLTLTENPHARIEGFEENLRRKQAFVDNAPSQETKERLQKELDEYAKSLDLIRASLETSQNRKRRGLTWSVVFIVLVSVLVWWGYSQHLAQQELEAQRIEAQYQEQLRQQNQQRIKEFSELGAAALSKRKWNQAEHAYLAIHKIDASSKLAADGMESIRLGKLEERNQKISYTLGNSQAALEAGLWDKAAELVLSILKDHPDHKEALAKLQKISEQRQAQETALKVSLVSQSLEAGNLSGAQKALADLKKVAPRHERISELSRALEVALAEVQARQRKAAAILKQAQELDNGQFSASAMKLIDEARQLDPANPEIAALHQKMSRYTRTIQVPADFKTIGEALDASRPRDRIHIAAGIYQESLVIVKPVRLEGSADGKTVVELPAAEAPLITMKSTASGTHIVGLTLRHSGFDHGQDRASAVIVQDGEATIDSCQISHAAGHGVAVIDGAKVIITGCKISECGWDGISVYGQNEKGASHAEIRDTYSQNNIQHGIEFWKGGDGSVSNSRVLANGLCGILAMSPKSKIVIQTTLCARNRGAGILISDHATAELIANRCDKNLLSGIVARGAGTTVSITQSIATGNQEVGILIYRGVKREDFRGNQAKSNKLRQVWLDATMKP